jgi:hypothetical protein
MAHAMGRHPESKDAGFDRAEALESMVAEVHHDHATDVRDLLSMADFLAPEVHRDHGVEEAAAEIAEWADGDAELLAEAERLARRHHHGDSAQILHVAQDYAHAA